MSHQVIKGALLPSATLEAFVIKLLHCPLMSSLSVLIN